MKLSKEIKAIEKMEIVIRKVSGVNLVACGTYFVDFLDFLDFLSFNFNTLSR